MPISASSATDIRRPPPWHAALELRFARIEGATRLVDNRHHGPLRLQKLLYPQDRSQCEALLLHPPGGIAGGDVLDLSVQADEGAAVLLSTPGAAKWYRSAGRTAIQRTRLRVATGASLEWLPQEAILFEQADAMQTLDLQVDDGAATLGWDIVQLGRTAAGDHWRQGRFRQSLTLSRGARAVWIDRADFEAGDPVRQALTGLAGRPVSGTLWAASPQLEAQPETVLAAVRELLDAHLGQAAAAFPATRLHHAADWVQAPLCAAASLLPAPANLLLVRALGHDAEALRMLLEAVWSRLRPLVLHRPGYRPRIWAT